MRGDPSRPGVVHPAGQAVQERGAIGLPGQGEVGARFGQHRGEGDTGIAERRAEGVEVLLEGAPDFDGVEPGRRGRPHPVRIIRAGLGEQQFDVGRKLIHGRAFQCY